MSIEKIRSNLKNNFLRETVFKVEFEGMLDIDVEMFIQKIRLTLFNRGYKTIMETYAENIGLNISEDEVSAKRDRDKVYILKSESNKRISIMKTGVYLNIDMDQNETLFKEYLDTITFIINQLKDISYIQFKSIGLKKINSCVIKQEKRISSYFKNNVFNKFSKNSISSHTKDIIFDSNSGCIIQYDRVIQEGIINENENSFKGYQIVLEIDSNIDSFEINTLIRKNDTMSLIDNINTKIFNIYYDSLTEDFIKKLEQEEFEDEYIKGVSHNVYK